MSDLYLLVGRKAIMSAYEKYEKKGKGSRPAEPRQVRDESKLPLISYETFHDFTKGNAIILIGLYGCAPCNKMDNYLGALDGDFPPRGKIELMPPVNLSEFRKKYGISVPKKVPRLYFFRDGELVCMSVLGVMPEEVPPLMRSIYGTITNQPQCISDSNG